MEKDEFQVDDRVWDRVWGWGTITSMTARSVDDIYVYFDRGVGEFRPASCLFFEEVPIPESALRRPEPPQPKYDFQRGDVILVGNYLAILAIFARWSDDGRKVITREGRQYANFCPYGRTKLGYPPRTEDK